MHSTTLPRNKEKHLVEVSNPVVYRVYEKVLYPYVFTDAVDSPRLLDNIPIAGIYVRDSQKLVSKDVEIDAQRPKAI